MVNLIHRLFNKLSDDGSSRGVCYYSGPYHSGKAYYEYIMMDGKRVYEGVFRYKFSNRYAGSYGLRREEHATGRFSSDRKTGHWRYEMRESGRKRRLDVNYSDGLVDGPYSYVEMVDHAVLGKRKCIQRIELVFAEGRPVGDIAGKTDLYSFWGHIDQDGYPDGLWRMENKRMGYYEQWEKGVLKSSYSVDQTTGDKRETKPGIIQAIDLFVSNDCQPLEYMERRGSNAWHGGICRLSAD